MTNPIRSAHFMRGLTQERRHSSAPNVTVGSLHKIIIIKGLPM